MILALAGGVGAARFLRGVVSVVEPTRVSVIVNTADDFELHGLYVSPDLDTVTYTLAGASDPERGWGLAGETWSAMDAMERYGPVAPAGSVAGLSWFRLGDRDLATHLYRTQRLREGAPLSAVAAEVARAWGVGPRLIPMSDDPVRTIVDVAGEGEVPFQHYFVRLRHRVEAKGVRFSGASDSNPAAGVLDSIAAARSILICPSNPVVSVAPILAVPGVREALRARRDRVVAVSPIVGGTAVRGPADRLMRELGQEPSVVGVARAYSDVACTLVIDVVDAGLAPAVEAEGVRAVVAPTIMHGPDEAAALAQVALEAVV